MYSRSNFTSVPVCRLAIYLVAGTTLVCAQSILAASLQGTVTNAAGAPLDGICLEVSAPSTDQGASVRSDSAGMYTFELAPDSYFLETWTECAESSIPYENRYWASEGPTVYQWDRTVIDLSEGDALTGFDFQLAAGRQITGRVTGPTGEAVQDVLVEFYGGSCWSGRLREVPVDASGNYVANVRVGEVFAAIFPECSVDAVPILQSTWWSSDGGTQACPQATPVPDDGGPLRTIADFQLKEAAIVTGTIKAEDGSIIEGAVAQAFSGPNWEGFLQDSPSEPTTGRYVLCLSEGDGDVYVRAFFGNDLNQPPETDPEASDATRYASEWWEDALSLDEQNPVAVAAGSSVTIDFALRTAGYITGVVTDGDSGTPLAGIGVGAYATTCFQPGPSGAVSWIADAVTKEDGRYYLWTAEPAYLVSCDENCILGGTPFDGAYQHFWYDGTGVGSVDCQNAMLMAPGDPIPQEQSNFALQVIEEAVACPSRALSSYEQEVRDAFIGYYGRPPDTEGLGYWSNRLEAEGGNLSSIIDAFGNSAEFDERFGDMTNTELVTNLYHQLFNREPDEAGLAYYVGKLDANELTLQSIALDILYGTQGSDVPVLESKQSVAGSFVSQVQAAGQVWLDVGMDLLTPVSDPISRNVACNRVENALPPTP